jgi:glutamate racemase
MHPLPVDGKGFSEALGPGVKVYSQANLVAASLEDYLRRRPEFLGSGTESKFLTTGDPRAVSDRATQFLKRRIAFQAALISNTIPPETCTKRTFSRPN